MNRLFFFFAAALIALVQLLPLSWAAWLGRQLGALAWLLDWRHRRQALVNLDIALGASLPRGSRERLAFENFRRLGESFLSALKTASMSGEELAQRLQVVGLSKIRPWIDRSQVPGVVIVTGHFANIEMYESLARELPWMRVITVFRASSNPVVRRVVERMRRDRRGEFFEAQTQAGELRAALREGNVILGLMGDTNPGPDGLSVPFFGHPVATSATPAVYALRFRMPLYAAVCYRTAAARWRVEISDEIPTRVQGRARPIVEILADLNLHLEQSIRRDPANWFWQQPRWDDIGRIGRRDRSKLVAT